MEIQIELDSQTQEFFPERDISFHSTKAVNCRCQIKDTLQGNDSLEYGKNPPCSNKMHFETKICRLYPKD